MPLTSVYQKSKKNYADKRAKQKPCKDFFFTGRGVVFVWFWGCVVGADAHIGPHKPSFERGWHRHAVRGDDG
jgi:hypothetical protein